MKQVDWLAEMCRLYHYRDKVQDEVDIIVEGEGGDVVGIEVKAAATVTAGDFKELRKLSAASGKDFKLGVVLYGADGVFRRAHVRGTYLLPVGVNGRGASEQGVTKGKGRKQRITWNHQAGA